MPSDVDAMLERFRPEVADEARACVRAMRKMLGGGCELVYDNYNALVFGYGATDRASEAVLSLAVFPRWVTLCFLYGAGLADPQRLLKGSGSRVRNIPLTGGAAMLKEPAVRDLVAAARAQSRTPFGAKRWTRVIKSVSARQRPRRP